jgi:hypothetical protein
MKKTYIDKISQGLFNMVFETKVDNAGLIKRAKVLDATAVLTKSLQLHTQRRLSGKLNADPDATVDKLFADFQAAVGVIK